MCGGMVGRSWKSNARIKNIKRTNTRNWTEEWDKKNATIRKKTAEKRKGEFKKKNCLE